MKDINFINKNGREKNITKKLLLLYMKIFVVIFIIIILIGVFYKLKNYNYIRKNNKLQMQTNKIKSQITSTFSKIRNYPSLNQEKQMLINITDLEKIKISRILFEITKNVPKGIMFKNISYSNKKLTLSALLINMNEKNIGQNIIEYEKQLEINKIFTKIKVIKEKPIYNEGIVNYYTTNFKIIFNLI